MSAVNVVSRVPVIAMTLSFVSLLLMACSEVEEVAAPAPTAIQTIQSSPGILSETEATSAARDHAAYLIQDRPVGESFAELKTYAEASAILAGGMDPDPPRPGAPVWVVTLKGLFYEPSGPAPDEDSGVSPPRQPGCSLITVLVDDASGDYIRLTFQAATG